jgi:hypothetical protein
MFEVNPEYFSDAKSSRQHLGDILPILEMSESAFMDTMFSNNNLQTSPSKLAGILKGVELNLNGVVVAQTDVVGSPATTGFNAKNLNKDIGIG